MAETVWRDTLEKLKPDVYVARFYGGVSIATTADGRALDDLAGDQQHRLSNFLRSAKVSGVDAQLEVFKFIFSEDASFKVDRDAKTASSALWAHDILQNLERLLVGVLPPCGRLNSAFGGLELDWEPDEDNRKLQRTVQEAIAGLLDSTFSNLPLVRRSARSVVVQEDQGNGEKLRHLAPMMAPRPLSQQDRADVSDFVREHAAQFLDWSRQIWLNRPSQPEVIEWLGFKDVLDRAMCSTVADDGHPERVRVLKDLPETAFRRDRTGVDFFGKFAGQSMRTQRRIIGLARGFDLNSLPEEDRAVAFGPILDLWWATLVHVEVVIVIILLVVCLVKPELGLDCVCMTVASSKVSTGWHTARVAILISACR